MSWLPFYREVVQVLATYENRQDELLALLSEMKSQGLPASTLGDPLPGEEDSNENPDGAQVEFSAIDPFTFLSQFHGQSEATRVAMWKFLRQKWHLSEPVPSDYRGLPQKAQGSWFVPQQPNPDDTAALWTLFQAARQAPPGGVGKAIWMEAAQVPFLALTTRLFWINPTDYLSLDDVMLKYLARFGIVPDMKALHLDDIAAYSDLLARVHEKLGHDHVHLTREAWETREAPDPKANAATRQIRYWAGGHDWSTGGQQLDRFRTNNEWQLGYSPEKLQDYPDQRRKFAQRMLALFAEIRIGDELAIKGGNAQNIRVYYVGRVREIDAATRTVKLEPLAGRPRYQGPRPIGKDAGVWTESLLEVKRPEDIQLIFGVENARQDGAAETEEKVEETAVLPDFPLNTILYGPPGTGKTFTSVSRAVEIIQGAVPTSRQECSRRFEELRASGRIGFVTFHQSFAYEEFIEGLRPVLDEGAQNGARYEVRPGALKNIALRALGACLEAAEPGRATFEDVWQKLLDKVEGDLSWELPGIGSSRYRLEVTPAGNLRGTNVAQGSTAQAPYNATLVNIEMVWDALRNGPTATHNAIYSILKKGAHTNLIGAVVEELKRFAAAPKPPSNLISDPTQAARSFLSGSKDYRLKRDLSRVPRFVLVVDEINRGNISKILGELITLLEDDKRLGRLNALRVTLPYSGDTFALPPNLYLLGTMNTADKSLALLDVALRRRFTFEEMPPDFSPDVCPLLPPQIRAVLHALNTRLMLLLDREHRLGHAFFIDVQSGADFNRVFALKIVPLLQEFFYNDWEGLRSVLGETGTGKIVRTLPVIDGVRGRNRFVWWSDLGTTTPDFYQTLRANYGLSASTASSPVADGTSSSRTQDLASVTTGEGAKIEGASRVGVEAVVDAIDGAAL